jgi:hypothetical protein
MSDDHPIQLAPPGQASLVIDFEKAVEQAGRYIEGTAADLVRDGYDNPQRWLHNAHAQPDDRCAAFLVGRGWSVTPKRLKQLAKAGIPWMAINDFPKKGPKPRYWCAGDGPNHYGNRIWDDAEIMKFSPMGHVRMVRPRTDAYEPARRPMDAPNTHFIHPVNNLMELESWLHVPYIAWGASLHGPTAPSQFHKSGSGRSSMMIGLRLLWHLGYREVYMLGCDCTPHHHPAPNYWKVMFDYIEKIAPTFRRFCYNVYQTNPDAHLRTFPSVPFDKALADAAKTRT